MSETKGCVCGTDNGRHTMLCPGRNVSASPAEQEYTPTEAENDRIEDAAERLRHYGYGHLAEAVERLAEARADERAKRPHREQLKATLAAHTCTSAHGLGNGVTVAYCQCDWWGTSEDYKNHRADAVLSSLALEPETREITGAEAEAAVLAVEKVLEQGLRLALLGPAVTLDALNKHLPGILAGFAGQAARAALEAAREVSRG